MLTICAQCGNIVKPGNTFCNKACYDKWQSQYPNRTARKGEGNGNWKGGKTYHSKGYIYEYCPDHYRADARGYVLQHILVMERKIGRLLWPWETVHHKNGVKDQNDEDNLELFWTTGEHSKHEAELRRAM